MKRSATVLAQVLGVALLASACNDVRLVDAPNPEPGVSPLPPPPAEADITITEYWDDLGLDWELHLVKPGGHINDNATDCTWTSCIFVSPDWGVIGDSEDDPHKDYDDTDQYGPERVWLANPEAGTYTVLVEHWGAGQPTSDGFVTIDINGQTVTISMTDLSPRHVWSVATIAWPSGEVTPSQAVFDCTASWSGGCTASLP